MSSDTKPTAGNNFTLACNVLSDAPVTLEWVGSGVGRDGVVVHPQVVNGFNSVLVIEFSPLHTSHGGVYTCVSTITPSPSVHNSELDHSLIVKSKLAYF